MGQDAKTATTACGETSLSPGPAAAWWMPMVDTNLLGSLRALVAAEIAPAAEDIDRRDIYPAEQVRALARGGFNSLSLPETFGGGGRGFAETMAVFEEASYASAAVGISLITIFQAQTILRLYGTPSLQQAYLPRFREGLLTSYALTEANHGSDIRQLDTKARRDGGDWILAGQKSFITSGSAATVFIILAQSEGGVSAFLVPREAKGVRTYVGENSGTFGLRNGPHVELVLERVRLPADHLVGEEGRGVRQAVTTLDYSRAMAAAISLGIARAAFDGAFAFALGRRAFDQRIADFQGIQWYFAEMLSEIDAARLLAYRAAVALDRHADIDRLSSEAKLQASAVATRVASQAVQICGAYGVTENAPFGRYLRDAKAYEIAGGSSEILKNTIAKHLLRQAGGRGKA